MHPIVKFFFVAEITPTDHVPSGPTTRGDTGEKDLGVIIDRELKFYSRTRDQAADVNQALGLIKRNFYHEEAIVVRKLYEALVFPYLEFEMLLAFPQYKKDATALESIQCLATKLILH